MKKVFIDSTIWIDFFKGNDKKIHDYIIPLLEENRIYYNGIILSELLIGAISNKEFDFLKNNFKGFNYLELNEKDFIDASQIGFQLKRKGITVPLSDLIITSHCLQYDLSITTKDKHFNMIKKETKLDVVLCPSVQQTNCQ